MIMDKDIRAIPKYILAKIKKQDKISCPEQNNLTRYYSYLTIIKKQLSKITVAVRNYKGKWYHKQCAAHFINQKTCWVKDMGFTMMAGYRTGWYYDGIGNYPKWYEHKDWGYTDSKYFNMFAKIVNLEYLQKFPQYKYSAFENYRYMEVLPYLSLYEKYPQLEYLVKAGFKQYAISVQILKLIGKDKKFISWLLAHKKEITSDVYHIDVILKAYKKNQPLKDLQDEKDMILHYAHDESYKQFRDSVPKPLRLKLMKYLRKNKIRCSLYNDYFKACQFLHIDMSEEKNLIPHEFMRWHDIRIDQYHTAKAESDKKERMKLSAQFGEIANKYLALQHEKRNAFICIIAKSPADLINEGDILHHCVGRMNYDQKFIKEQSLIFFIRLKNKPETPFVTLEYSLISHKILQCYAEHDTTPNKEVLHYVNKVWLPYANRQIKQIAA